MGWELMAVRGSRVRIWISVVDELKRPRCSVRYGKDVERER